MSYNAMTDQQLRDQLKERTRLKGSVIARLSRDAMLRELLSLDHDTGHMAVPVVVDAKVKLTQQVRMHIDFDLERPHDAFQLQVLASLVTGQVNKILYTRNVRVTQTIPAEGERFDWQGQ